ncbi:MAG: PadR family transcriptional regulator [Actinomycetota bacterium]|nr:PadR family transcriptional regulator [Actinomycetota bacterium]
MEHDNEQFERTGARRGGRRGGSFGDGRGGWDADGRGGWDGERGGRFNRGGRGGPFGGPRGGGFGPRGGGRMKRGDIRTAVLVILSEQSGHGYQIIQALEEKTAGAWRPSPGSVYPTLQLLEDSGLATSSEQDGKRVYSITDAGRVEAEQKVEEAGRLPWEGSHDGGPRHAMMQLQLAARAVFADGNPARIEAATEILDDARKRLYQLLAE